ncbi:MAG: IS1 family transposase [Coleofasciculus sp. Co-bin14]|nr:IS1 family transposase [Coleofasciculus sp. Co-bin14]
MNPQETFYLNKLRCEVAMQQALKEWQPSPRSSGIECPRCQSPKIVRYGSPGGKQRYFCNGCRRAFTERPKIECNCSHPGQQSSCQDCPQFKEFLALVEQKVDGLRGLNQQELQSRLSPSSGIS